MTRTRTRLSLHPLEDRLAPASFTAARVGGTLIVTQTTAAIGQITITDNPVAGTVTVDDPGDLNPVTNFSTIGRPSLAVRLQPADATTATYRIESARAGSVSLSVQNTFPRSLLLDTVAPIGGSLTVSGGNGGLIVAESGAALQVGRNATFRGGLGEDTLALAGTAGTSVGGTLTALRFNKVFTNAGDGVGGNLVFNAAAEATSNTVNLTNTQVLGSLSYVGGTRSDELNLNGTTQVSRNVSAAFGAQLVNDFSQFSQNVGAVIGGQVRVTGSSLGVDSVVLDGTVGGAVAISLGGGSNGVSLTGQFTGPTFGYVGGSGVDTINYTPLTTSVRARFSARLGAGADTVSFNNPATNPSFAFIDFGAGTDTLTGAVNFSSQFLNLT